MNAQHIYDTALHNVDYYTKRGEFEAAHGVVRLAQNLLTNMIYDEQLPLKIANDLMERLQLAVA